MTEKLHTHVTYSLNSKQPFLMGSIKSQRDNKYLMFLASLLPFNPVYFFLTAFMERIHKCLSLTSVSFDSVFGCVCIMFLFLHIEPELLNCFLNLLCFVYLHLFLKVAVRWGVRTTILLAFPAFFCFRVVGGESECKDRWQRVTCHLTLGLLVSVCALACW